MYIILQYQCPIHRVIILSCKWEMVINYMSSKGNKSLKWWWMLNRLFIAKFFIREWYITNSLSEFFCFDIHINYSAIWSTALKISSLRQMNHILYFIKTQHLKISHTILSFYKFLFFIFNSSLIRNVWFWEKHVNFPT